MAMAKLLQRLEQSLKAGHIGTGYIIFQHVTDTDFVVRFRQHRANRNPYWTLGTLKINVPSVVPFKPTHHAVELESISFQERKHPIDGAELASDLANVISDCEIAGRDVMAALQIIPD